LECGVAGSQIQLEHTERVSGIGVGAIFVAVAGPIAVRVELAGVAVGGTIVATVWKSVAVAVELGVSACRRVLALAVPETCVGIYDVRFDECAVFSSSKAV